MAFLVLVVPAAPAYPVPGRTLGDSRVVAHVPPSPGFPEGVAVEGKTMYVSGPAQSGNLGNGVVYAFSTQTGALLRTLPISPVEQGKENGFAGDALDGSGHVYVAGQQGVIRLDLTTGQRIRYAAIPDLHPCSVTPAPCSPTSSDRPPFPNDVAFDSAGNLYVTDSFQATVWRVAPGGGDPAVWCQDSRFDAPSLGPNGVRMRPNSTDVVITVSGPPGGIFVLTPSADGSKCDRVSSLHAYGDGELPDGLAYGTSGRLYVTLAGTNQVAVIDQGGSETTRYSGPARDGATSVPWDSPASVAFDNSSGSLLVANHALVTGLADKSRFVVFDVFVNDRGVPLARPAIA